VSTSKKLPPKKPKTKSSVLKIGSSSLQTDDPKELFAHFPIVGIGASAGGLEAFTKLLANLPIDTGMGFVLIQHLDPKHESLSSDILSRVTKMPVIEVKNGMRVEQNHIYVIPAGFRMGILHGVLNLIPRVEDRSQHFVIDFFFEDVGTRSTRSGCRGCTFGNWDRWYARTDGDQSRRWNYVQPTARNCKI
jgi:two-component system CheB/CheR fusion protein